MDPTLYIFDWSGTLSDDRKPSYESVMRMLSDSGLPRMSFEDWSDHSYQSAIEQVREFGLTGDFDDIYRRYARMYQEVYQNGLRPEPYPYVEESLTVLRNLGSKIAIVSAHPEESLKAEVSWYGLDKYFDYVRGSTRDKAMAITEIRNMLGVDPAHTYYIGDTIFDIRSAKEAGVHAIAVSYGYHEYDHLLREQPEYLFRSITEMTDKFTTPEGQTLGRKEIR